MNVDSVARQIGVQDGVVVGKARELMRLASVRIASGLGQGEVCKAAACLELACATSATGCLPPRDKFVRYGCTTTKVYQATYNMLQKALQVQPVANLQDIAIKFDATHLLEPVRQLLALYKARFTARLAAPAQPSSSGPSPSASPSHASASSADFSRPVFAAAAFWLVGRLKKVPLDSRKLCVALSIASTDFKDTLASFSDVCADVVGPALQAGKAAGKKRGPPDSTAAAEGATEEGLSATVDHSAPSKQGGAGRTSRQSSSGGRTVGKQRRKVNGLGPQEGTAGSDDGGGSPPGSGLLGSLDGEHAGTRGVANDGPRRKAVAGKKQRTGRGRHAAASKASSQRSDDDVDD